MAKKDDDLHLPGHSRHKTQWRAAAPRRRLLTRLCVYAAVVLIFFTIVYQLASTVGSSFGSKKWNPSNFKSPIYEPLRPVPKGRPEDRKGTTGDAAKAYTYDGPIKFRQLAKSLQSISGTGGSMLKNRNVLFAAASLKSAATLLPMACQMALERDNYVHFALVGRSEIPMNELLKVNGVDEACKLLIHDARPDYASTSTDARMTLASARALYHINQYMHPQAIIVDGTDTEEGTFLNGFQDQVRTTRAALIELPERAHTRLSWITKLDASALSAWNKVHFDILIQAPASGAGNLRRLLQSLSRADLSSVSVPHLTIELPSVVSSSLESLVAKFRWPSWSLDVLGQPQTFSVRHRISGQKLTEEESSVRFLESFWPRQPAYSHVLVLSPHTEITPQFFHYVKYSLLHHCYSSAALLQDWDKRLIGISFEHPTTMLDTSTPFVAPQSGKSGDAAPPFLWQAPSSDAVLYLGEKWVELHGYLSQLLEKRHSGVGTPAFLATKEVSKKHPSWLEYVLQLSRLRGYVMLYPSQDTASAILGVHSDLYDEPEEYQGQNKEDVSEPGDEDQASELFDSGSQVDILTTIPNRGTFQQLRELSLITWNGKPATTNELDKGAAQYASHFRMEVGECLEGHNKKVKVDKYARDLFCKTKDTKEGTA